MYYLDNTVYNFDLSVSQYYDCGYYKFFIPSKSNQDIGYLIKVETKKHWKEASETMPKMIGKWQLVQWIDGQFGDLPTNGLHCHFYNNEP